MGVEGGLRVRLENRLEMETRLQTCATLASETGHWAAMMNVQSFVIQRFLFVLKKPGTESTNSSDRELDSIPVLLNP